jgi:hypothetical protein
MGCEAFKATLGPRRSPLPSEAPSDSLAFSRPTSYPTHSETLLRVCLRHPST